MIAGGKVYVNSKEVYSNSYQLKENDVVSVRGYGKFIFQGTSSVTKRTVFGHNIAVYLRLREAVYKFVFEILYLRFLYLRFSKLIDSAVLLDT